MDNLWKIRFNNSRQIKVKNCDFWDSLSMFDGGTRTSPFLGKYCGHSVPPIHISTTDNVVIDFENDF